MNTAEIHGLVGAQIVDQFRNGGLLDWTWVSLFWKLVINERELLHSSLLF